MTVQIVDVFEVIEVEEHEREALAVAFGRDQRLLDAVVEEDAIRKPGQPVVEREGPEAFLVREPLERRPAQRAHQADQFLVAFAKMVPAAHVRREAERSELFAETFDGRGDHRRPFQADPAQFVTPAFEIVNRDHAFVKGKMGERLANLAPEPRPFLDAASYRIERNEFVA